MNRSQTLAPVSARKAKQFLMELANLGDEAAVSRFEGRFGGLFLPELPRQLIQDWARQVEEEEIGNLLEHQKIWKYWLRPLRDSVRLLWSSDQRIKRWAIFRILEKYFQRGSYGLTAGPVKDDFEWSLPATLGPETACERILMHLSGRTSRCNNPDCPAPYFFATRRSQQFCSEDCAIPAQQESKRKWWAENGTAWRQERAASSKNRRKRQSREPKPRSVGRLP